MMCIVIHPGFLKGLCSFKSVSGCQLHVFNHNPLMPLMIWREANQPHFFSNKEHLDLISSSLWFLYVLVQLLQPVVATCCNRMINFPAKWDDSQSAFKWPLTEVRQRLCPSMQAPLIAKKKNVRFRSCPKSYGWWMGSWWYHVSSSIHCHVLIIWRFWRKVYGKSTRYTWLDWRQWISLSPT